MVGLSGFQRSRMWRRRSLPKDLRVMTFNVLCEQYAKTERGRHPDRWMYVLSELRNCKGDVVCIQEVDVKLWARLMSDLSDTYEGEHLLKSGLSEGVGILWAKHRFKHLESHSTLFIDSPVDFKKNQVALHVALDDTVHKSQLLVSTTHLLFNAKRGDIRLYQLMRVLHDVAKLKLLFPKAASLICGDMNITPHDDAYYWLCGAPMQLDDRISDEQLVSSSHMERAVRSSLRDHNGGTALRKMTDGPIGLKASRRLLRVLSAFDEKLTAHDLSARSFLSQQPGYTSAYADMSDDDIRSEAACTAWSPHQKACVDYIFFETERFVAVAVLEVPDCRGMPDFPNREWAASDHVSLVADLAILSQE